MSRFRYKHSDNDKHDGYMPNEPRFVHDNYSVSNKQESFHSPNAYAYTHRNSKSVYMGVQKKLYWASSKGVHVDCEYVGKTEI